MGDSRSACPVTTPPVLTVATSPVTRMVKASVGRSV